MTLRCVLLIALISGPTQAQGQESEEFPVHTTIYGKSVEALETLAPLLNSELKTLSAWTKILKKLMILFKDGCDLKTLWQDTRTISFPNLDANDWDCLKQTFRIAYKRHFKSHSPRETRIIMNYILLHCRPQNPT